MASTALVIPRRDLHRQFPSVGLADICHAIAYSIRNKDEVDEYLRQARAQADEAIELAKARGFYQDYDELRERLLRRLNP